MTHIVDRSAITKRLTGVSDCPNATTCPGLTLRSTITPLRGAPTTTPGRANTSSTRPVTGAFTRTSCSSLNWTLPVVSSSAGRVTTAGLTVLIDVADVEADSFFGGAAGAEVTTSWHAAQHRAITMR